jgi:hypothetical protein
MDHHDATQLAAVERYLLQELSPEQCAQFEEHFFDCPECAVDLRATAAFLHAVKDLKSIPAQASRGPSTATGRRIFRAREWLAAAATLLLGVVAYQSSELYRLGGEVARLRQPGIPLSLPVIRGDSRAGAVQEVPLFAGEAVLLPIEIPPNDHVSGYECVMLDPSGQALWRAPVSAEQAKDTVYIAINADTLRQGRYTLLVQGHRKDAGGEPIDLIRFALSISDRSVSTSTSQTAR